MKYILLWCSPGFGVLDIWLPVIKELKKRNVKVDFVFPEPSSLLLENNNTDLFKLSEQFVDNVIFRGFSGNLYIESSLLKAQSKMKFNKLYEKMQQVSIRLTKGRASKFFILKKIGECFSFLSRMLILIEERFSSLVLYDTGLFDRVEAVLYDVVKEGKIVNKELRSELKDVHKYSMLHGLAVPWVLDEFQCKGKTPKRSDVTVYCMSKNEIDYYHKCYGVLKKNIIPIGIPRHDKSWIELVASQKYTAQGKLFDNQVFIIGRPASPYNTLERKLKALNDIYEVVCIKYNLKLVVKTHPKESADEGIYIKAFGDENYGKTWIYSDQHPLLIGKDSIFCISFYSGVIIDMLAINKPTIEYLNLEGLSQYDNKKSLRDTNDQPVFQYRYTNLVLGASNKSALSAHVSSIVNDFENVIKPMRSKYDEYFPKFNDCSKRIADNIYYKKNTN